jgi:hypothetical protein
MKRRALIVGNAGNADEFLLGVEKDVSMYKKFLLSNQGGAWYEQEIIVSLNETKAELENKILKVKNEKNDFMFVVFTGHGSFSKLKQCRKLYVNDDYIYESALLFSSRKQITVIDTCAGIENDMLLESRFAFTAMQEFNKQAGLDHRILYENAIRICPDKQSILYSCDVDETSADTSKGGLFSLHLIQNSYDNKLRDILTTQEIYLITTESVQQDPRTQQNPQYFTSSRSGAQLPFSLKE